MSGPSAEEPVRPDIVGFLRARIAEEEEAGRIAAEREHPVAVYRLKSADISRPGHTLPILDYPVARYVPGKDLFLESRDARLIYDPDRVLREVEAKRRIVDRCRWILESFEDREHGMWPDVNRRERHHARVALEDLAGVYDQHPDYGPAWRPS